MQRWKVIGANRQTGKNVEIFVDAASETDAARNAGETGMVIAEIIAVSAPPVPQYQPVHPVAPLPMAMPGQIHSKRVLAGVMALLLGGLGVHKFVMGYGGEGAVYLVLWFLGFLVCFTWPLVLVMALIEGIIYLSKSDEEFIRTYQIGHKSFF